MRKVVLLSTVSARICEGLVRSKDKVALRTAIY